MEPYYSKAFLLEHELLEPCEEYVKQFIGTDIEFISTHLGIRKILDNNRRFQLNLAIDSETTLEEIIKAFPEIKRIRKALTNVQGDEFSDYVINILYQLETSRYSYFCPSKKLQNRLYKKPSMVDLTKDVNFDALVFLVASVNEKNDPVLREFSKNAFTDLVNSFIRLQKKISEMDSFYNTSIEDLKNDCLYWDITEYPISKSDMREKIRYIKETRLLNSLSNLVEISKIRLMNFYLLFVKSGDWGNASLLLKKVNIDNYSNYEPRLNARLSEILDSAPKLRTPLTPQ